jgi:hypothetical protein
MNFENLRTHAAMNHRSLNNEIIVCIEKAIKSRRIDPKRFLDRLQRIRRENKLPFLTDQALQEMKNEGRT